MTDTNTQILLARRPNGEPVPADFEVANTAIPEPGDGQFLARTVFERRQFVLFRQHRDGLLRVFPRNGIEELQTGLGTFS